MGLIIKSIFIVPIRGGIWKLLKNHKGVSNDRMY